MHAPQRSTGSGPLFRRLLAIALIMGFVASACGGTTTASDTAAADDTAAVPAEETLSGEFASLDGTTVDLATLQGEDVVLWFWAPW